MHIFVVRKSVRQKSDVLYAAFSTAMFFLVTLWLGLMAISAQEEWLLSGNYPGGQVAYANRAALAPFRDADTTTGIILQLMTDGLMVRLSRWM